MKRLLFIIGVSFAVSGCALAPLMSSPTARPLGKGKWAGNLSGYLPTGAAVAYGLTDALEVGLSAETQLGATLALNTQYSLIHGGEESLALAVHGGAFYAEGTTHQSYGGFAGISVSKKWGWFEAMLLGRYNHFTWQGNDIRNDDSDGQSAIADSIFSSIAEGSGSGGYAHFGLSVNAWLHESFALNFAARSLVERELVTGSIFPSIGIVYRPNGHRSKKARSQNIPNTSEEPSESSIEPAS